MYIILYLIVAMIVVYAIWYYSTKLVQAANKIEKLEQTQIPEVEFSETYPIDDDVNLIFRASSPIRPLSNEEVKRFNDMLHGLINFEITDFVDREKLEQEIDQDIVERVTSPLIPPVDLNVSGEGTRLEPIDMVQFQKDLDRHVVPLPKEEEFNFDKIVTVATEASHARRDKIRKRLLTPKYFTAALTHLADKSLSKDWLLGEDITITKGFMPPGELILNQEEAQIFFDAFLKLCTDKGIKAKLGPCLDIVQVNRKSFEEYRARIMGE